MKIIITESQFKRLIENIISESDSRRQEFIDILNKEKFPYEIKDSKQPSAGMGKIIIGGYIIDSDLITYIPDNVEFNNNSHVELYSVNKMGNNIEFNNDGDVGLYSLEKIGNNIEFNNDGTVWLDSLKKMGDNIKFNNNGNVNLESIIWFDTFSVNFTNNVDDVHFGQETFWMGLFPYELYNIKGDFYILNKEDKYEIIK